MFDTIRDAEAYLATVRADIVRDGLGNPTPAGRKAQVTFGDYAEGWLESRRVKGKPLAARTKAHYRNLLDEHILPTFAEVPLKRITPDLVDHWYGYHVHGHSDLASSRLLTVAHNLGHGCGSWPDYYGEPCQGSWWRFDQEGQEGEARDVGRVGSDCAGASRAIPG